MSDEIKNQAAADASTLLGAVSWPEGLLPIDPVFIARKIGLNVINADLGGDVLGALVKRSGEEPTILVNENDNENRRRLTCAHEIGHFVRRSPTSVVAEATAHTSLSSAEAEQFEIIDLRSDAGLAAAESDETYAAEFAASLLMPDSKVRLLKSEGLSEIEMAIRFGVSPEAIAVRLATLELDDGSAKKGLLASLGRG